MSTLIITLKIFGNIFLMITVFFLVFMMAYIRRENGEKEDGLIGPFLEGVAASAVYIVLSYLSSHYFGGMVTAGAMLIVVALLLICLWAAISRGKKLPPKDVLG